MNRPRNRQPRPGRDNQRHTSRRQTPAYNNNVPTSQQVVPGAAVSIVLKQDQPTGKEVEGIVQDLLTRGDHPRGIKVRLKDGRIGRVQRMVTGDLSTSQPISQPHSANHSKATTSRRTRGDEDGFSQEPPPRTFSDYIQNLEDGKEPAVSSEEASFASATIKCPICGQFEGDEAAVSHHVEEHLD